MYEVVNFSFFGLAWLVVAVALVAALIALTVCLVAAARALNATARWRRVQTELTLAEAADGPEGA